MIERDSQIFHVSKEIKKPIKELLKVTAKLVPLRSLASPNSKREEVMGGIRGILSVWGSGRVSLQTGEEEARSCW